MNVTHYIGLGVHKKSISYCVKRSDGEVVEQGKLPGNPVQASREISVFP
jgi:hypothetical protein